MSELTPSEFMPSERTPNGCEPFTLQSAGCFMPLHGEAPDWVVYLHGFRSSPSSHKAQLVLNAFEQAGLLDRLWVPALPASPIDAMEWVESEIRQRLSAQPNARLVFIGSSLGGFYATVLAERFVNAKVVVLNPSVSPHLSLQVHTGRQKVYFSDEEIEFLPAYLKALELMRPAQLTNLSRYFLVSATGDEVLSQPDMVARYAGAHALQIEGGDHALSGFEAWLPYVRLFCGVL